MNVYKTSSFELPPTHGLCFLRFGGIFHSDALHITERYTRVDYDTINYEATIEDKKVLTQPFKTSTTMKLREGARLREYICPENNENVQRLEKLLENLELFKRTPGQK